MRLFLLHRKIVMGALTNTLQQEEQTQVYRYEVVPEIVSEIIQRHTQSDTKFKQLPRKKTTTTNLLEYKVQKIKLEKYGQLLGGHSQ